MSAENVVTETSLQAGLSQFSHEVMQMDSVDEFSKELVRLRVATSTGCRLCLSLRSAEARRQGMTETIVSRITDLGEQQDVVHGDSLSTRERAVLALTDAFFNQPAAVPLEVREALRASFTPDQIGELLGKAMAHRNSQPYIAMGLNETPSWDQALYEYGADGSIVVDQMTELG